MSIKNIIKTLEIEDQLGIAEEVKTQEKEETSLTLQQRIDSFNWRFKTFNDKTLSLMFNKAKEFIIRVSRSEYCFFTLSGPTETGKTFLLNEMYRFFKLERESLNLKFGSEIIREPFEKLVSGILEDGERYFRRIEKCAILIADDLLHFNKQNAYSEVVVDLTYRILNRRSGKPTIMDTNKSIDDVQSIDERISSRLFRDGSIFIDIPKTTKKFLDRT